MQKSVQSFSAVCDKNTRTLILGSMPGAASLDAVQYYAHQRNAFWPIMLTLAQNKKAQAPLSFSDVAQIDYQNRLQAINAAGYGLWDVLAECEREGSLDSAIVANSIVTNDFSGLLHRFTHISTIAFNGKTAERVFKKHVTPSLKEKGIDAALINWVSLPSSSPAMASLNLQEKYDCWRQALS